MKEAIGQLADLLVKQRLGVAFGVTGSGPSLHLISELEDRGIRYFPTAHEAAASLMAGAYTRVAGRLAVSISIKGPGVVNMLPGIVANHYEGFPALSISEAYGANTPAFRKHKRLDHKAILSSFVKAYGYLDSVDDLPGMVDAARAEAPGPAHIDLCYAGVPAAKPSPAAISEGEVHVSSSRADAVLDRVRQSRRPLLVIGSLGLRRSWREQLARLEIPVFTTTAAKGVLDERLPHSAGVFTGDGKELASESHLVQGADLVIGLGLRNSEVLTAKPFGRPCILIDELTSDLAAGFDCELVVTHANGPLIPWVLDCLSGKRWGLEEIAVLRAALRDELLTAGWLPALCYDALDRLAYSYSMVLDTGSFCTVGEHLWPASPERQFLGSSVGRYMGTSIPTAIGVSVASPQSPVFCVMGDGGIRMYVAEIRLAVSEKLPICFLLMSDGAYGSVASAPQPRSMSLRAVSIPDPSWWRSLEALGCPAVRVEDPEAFARAVMDWDQTGPIFIEAVFDPNLYGLMTKRLR